MLSTARDARLYAGQQTVSSLPGEMDVDREVGPGDPLAEAISKKTWDKLHRLAEQVGIKAGGRSESKLGSEPILQQPKLAPQALGMANIQEGEDIGHLAGPTHGNKLYGPTTDRYQPAEDVEGKLGNASDSMASVSSIGEAGSTLQSAQFAVNRTEETLADTTAEQAQSESSLLHSDGVEEVEAVHTRESDLWLMDEVDRGM